MTGLTQSDHNIEKRLDEMIANSKNIRALANTALVDIYQRAQSQRWQTENQSEGQNWLPINATYRERKKVLFKDYPGAGTKTLVATNKLVNAATGRGNGFLKMVTNKTLVLGVDDSYVPYAKYVAEVRPFMSFGKDTKQQFKRAIISFIKGKK